MTNKIQYRATDVQSLSLESLLSKLPEASPVVVGVDVAKRKFLAALCDSHGDVKSIVRFEHPIQTPLFVELLRNLQSSGRTVEVAMEPTGTYGDPLRYSLGQNNIAVFRVSNKHVHDAAELFDRAASKHDAKDSCVIAWLHAHKRSTLWQELSTDRRAIRALINQRELFDRPLRRLITQMEPLLARHFPELEKFFDLSRAKTPYRLLEKFGSPAAIGKCAIAELASFLRESSRRLMDQELVDALQLAARSTSGLVLVPQELALMQMMATEILRLMHMRDRVDAHIRETVTEIPEVQAIRPLLGAVTAAVVYAYLGSPQGYRCAEAFEKAAGLNLIERSSGTNPGGKHLSKRGSGVVRKFLFLAAMRLVHQDPIVKAWYQSRSSYKADNKAKALVAVQRKLCRSLFHITLANPFDATKLFDTRRLAVSISTEEAP